MTYWNFGQIQKSNDRGLASDGFRHANGPLIGKLPRPNADGILTRMAESNLYAGMTINERLAFSGLLSSFDTAVRFRDRDTMIRLLAELGVKDASASVDAVLQDPDRYGF